MDIRGVDGRHCSGGFVEFHRTGVPLEMHWLDSETLEVRYPKEIKPSWPCDDVSEHISECGGRRVRMVLVKI